MACSCGVVTCSTTILSSQWNSWNKILPSTRKELRIHNLGNAGELQAYIIWGLQCSNGTDLKKKKK